MAQNDFKTVAFRWEVLAWIVSEYGEWLTTDPQPVGVRPSIGEQPETLEGVNIEEMGGFFETGWNMSYAVAAVSTLDDTEANLVDLPDNNEALTSEQQKAVAKRMGVSAKNYDDMRVLWRPFRRMDVFRTQPAKLAEALQEIAQEVRESQSNVLRNRQLVGVLSSYATEATESAAVQVVEEREKAQTEAKPKFSVSPEDLELSGKAEIIFCLSRSDGKSTRAWKKKRAEEQWLGASVAASCLGVGVGYDTPEEVYENMMDGSPPKKVTNGMIAGIERQESVLDSLVASLQDDGWTVERKLPRFGEVSVISSAQTPWDVATLDCALHLSGGKVQGQDFEGVVVVEIKVPDTMPFVNSWSDWEETLGADGKLNRKKTFAVPEAVAAQVQDQMRITGLKVGLVAALAPNWEEARSDSLPAVKYEFLVADSAFQDQLWEGKQAMRRCLETKTPPSLDKKYYQKLAAQDVGVPSHTKEVALSGSTVELDKTGMQKVKKHREALEREKQAKSEVAAARAELDLAIGTAEIVVDATTGDEVASYKRREGIDVAKFLAQPKVSIVYLDGEPETEENINWSATLSNNPIAKQKAKTSGTIKGGATLRYK